MLLWCTWLQVIISDAGHACYMNQPEVFNDHLLGFLQACFARAADAAPPNTLLTSLKQQWSNMVSMTRGD